MQGKAHAISTYVSFIPLTEGSCVDLDDSALDQGVRSDKLIVRSVVDLAGLFITLR